MGNPSSLTHDISVALCTFNGEEFLSEQLDSILNQSYAHIKEIICVDDISSDNTWQILQDYASKDSRFKIYRNEKNLGFNLNFEKALSLTTCPFIAISDQDDIWIKDKISILIDTIGDSLMAYSDNEYIDKNGDSLGKRFSDYRNLGTVSSCLSFCFYNGISGHTILLHRDLLKYALPFNAGIPYDYWLAFHAAQFYPIAYANLPLVKYRQHSTNAIGATGVRIINKKQDAVVFQLRSFVKASKNATSAEQETLKELADIIHDFSWKGRIRKIQLFIANKEALLFFKKRSKARKFIICLKMFWKKF